MANDNSYVNNLNYTNKDFASIYRELLELVPKVTNKWNPQNSNESDPGVVLLKLLAVIGDKLNYNVDKNILEAYPNSVTQESNARQLYDSLGYSMHWYSSATTEISMKYTGDEITDGTVTNITIPPFTMVTSDSGDVVYTLLGTSGLSGATFSEKNQIQIINAIEGTLNQYTVSGNDTITLANLDEDFRLYFSQPQIAENGIFICNKGQNNFEAWQRISNLESNSLNSGAFKFDILPNSNTCYIQFPKDIANLIGEGLNIYYVVSQGEQGNISSNVLNKFYADIEIETDNSTINVTDSFVMNNASATMNGTNPETIQSAYNNYKKTIGTFNTLVTTRDYENALYQMSDTLSNVVVSDRTDDVTYSNHIITYNGVDNQRVLKVSKVNEDEDAMTAFDLGIYALYPMSNVYNVSNYNRSFTRSALSTADMNDLLSYNKSCQHNFIQTDIEDLNYIFKNFFTLTGKVLTNYKVTETEASGIESNIRTALYKNFNAHQVSFGEKPDYNNLIDVIKNADSRIRDIVLNEPQYTLRKIDATRTLGTFSDSDAVQLTEDSIDWVTLVARLVLNGTVQLYRFDKRFDYNFGQNSTDIIENIQKITTEVVIPYLDPTFTPTEGGSLSEGYLLKANENIQIYGPNLITTKTFTTYVEYSFAGLQSSITKDTVYELKSGESLSISYLDSNNVKQTASNNPECYYYEGDIICCSFDIEPDNGVVKGTLTASESIDIKEINKTTLDSTWGKYIYCYWVTNQKDDNRKDILFNANEYSRILDNNEYFIYTDATKTDIIILGSGTKLVRDSNLSSPVVNLSSVTREQINNNGPAALSSTDWYIWPTDSSGGSLEIIENQIHAFGEGTYVKLTSTGDNVGVTDIHSSTITNVQVNADTFKSKVSNTAGKYRFVKNNSEWKVNSGADSITLSDYGVYLNAAGTDNDNFTVELGAITNLPSNVSDITYGTDINSLTSISNMDLNSYSWEARSRLNLNASPEYAQKLISTQSINVEYSEEQTETFNGWAKDSLLFNDNLFLVGGIDLDMSITQFSGETDYTLAVYSFDSNPVISKLNNTGVYIRVPSSNLKTGDDLGMVSYTQGTKYDVTTELNEETDYTQGTAPADLTLDNVRLPNGTIFRTNRTLQPGLAAPYLIDSESEIVIKNIILPFTFNKADNYIIPMFKTGQNYKFTISSDITNVVFKPIVGTTSSNALTAAGMYYLKPDFTDADESVTSCSQMIITAALVNGGDNTVIDNLDVYKPVVLNSTCWGEQLSNIQMLGAIEKVICGHTIFGSATTPTQAEFIDNEKLFNYCYEVDKLDLIDVSQISSAEAFWDPHNPFTKYTIGQINTEESSISVASSSKLKR